MTKAEKRERLEAAEDRLDRIREQIAKKQAEAQKLEHRANHKEEKAKDRDDRAAERLEKEAYALTRQAREIRQQIDDLRPRAHKASEAVKKFTRQLRNRAKPKIIDLHLQFRPMSTQYAIDKVIGHYTAGPQDTDTDDAIRLCRIYHQAHLNQGWAGEAYMVCFTIDGDILLLRPSRYVGAHTYGYNTGSHGVMMHGTTGDTPSKAQQRTLKWWKRKGHTAAMPASHRSLRDVSALRWYGHNDLGATSCPGLFKPLYISKGEHL